MENYQASNPNPQQFTAEVRDFYQRDFKNLLLYFFTDPINGLRAFFTNPSEKAPMQAGILFATVFVLYFAGSYILVGDMRDYMSFSSFLSIGLSPVLVMLAAATLSFVVKLVSGGANFKSELLTGALCGIPLGMLVPIALVLRVFGMGNGLLSIVQNPVGSGSAFTVIMLYLFLMMVNVFQQSLRAAGIREVPAWYLAPLAILLSFYLGFTVAGNLL